MSISPKTPASPARRTRPSINALCNCIALAIILRRGKSVAEATRHFALHRNDALDAVLSPG